MFEFDFTSYSNVNMYHKKMIFSLQMYYLRLHNIVAAAISQDWLGILKIGLDLQEGLELS